MKLSNGAADDSAQASGNGISSLAASIHVEEHSLPGWAHLSFKAGNRLSPLPTFAEVMYLDREAAFRELGYTFWNQELLIALVERMSNTETLWLELGAGTGRLAVELSRRGVLVAATDDYSQRADIVRGATRPIEYGEWVAPLSAREAVAQFRPRGVLCAWPPLGQWLIPDLLAGAMPGSEPVTCVVCVGEPGGATEAPLHPYEMPPNWTREEWPECDQYLIGFNDPPPGDGWRTYSQWLVYRRA